jgi:hypothetical protein
MIFRLDSGPDFGESRFCENTIFPGFDRHHGPPLAGFAVCGLRFLLTISKARRGNRAAWPLSVNVSLIRVEPNFGDGEVSTPVGLRRGIAATSTLTSLLTA